MAYISLYRKYRPDSFSTMIGQEHIIRTLANQIRKGAVSHAYLFTGSRGTGKTTTAKIFARAINCEHPLADGSPCGKCDTCKALLQPSNMDVIEMDAASNNGVDEIRDLLEKVKFAPSQGKYKVYIVDEVHMLSMPAFNALLKTLEEPPEHVVFILATTEIQKVPATILSRCQRFDFRLVPTDKIAKLLSAIFDKEGKAYRIEALRLIAEAGGGCVRDSLSLAEMCMSYSEDEVTYDDVLEVLGASSPESVLRLAEDILAGRIDDALTAVKKTVREGKSARILASDLCGVFSNMIYCLNCRNPGEMLTLPEQLLERTIEVARSYDNAKLTRCLEIFASVDNDMRYGVDPALVIETAVAKACDEFASLDLAGVIVRLKKLEKSMMGGVKIVAASGAEIARPDVDAKAIVGAVQTELLRRGRPVEYEYINHVKSANFAVRGNVLAYDADGEGDAALMRACTADIEAVMREMYPFIARFEVNVKEKAEDPMNSKIKRAEEVFGSEKVTVKKGDDDNG